MPDFIVDEFYKEMETVSFDAYGILDTNNVIHTLGTDSKIIGRVFEMITEPVLERIAKRHNLILKTPDAQTVYPDFILMRDAFSKDKIAIDVKTTYIDSPYSKIKFTLGSFGSYMRNNTKNIEYTYTDYAKHYVIGFVYERNDAAQESREYQYDDRSKISFPYKNVKYFIQEKYKIAGDKPGSGNTENIGSFSTSSFEAVKNGEGPFSELGVDVFDLYWKYYPKYRSGDDSYKSLDEFADWFVHQDVSKLELLHPYDRADMQKRIEAYTKRKRF